MNKFKVFLGIILLYGIGTEYISASKHYSTFFSPGIIAAVLTMLVLCAWLIGSGLSKGKLLIKSCEFAKYFGLSFLVFLLVAFISLSRYKAEPDVVKVNGIEVDISEFMNGTKRIIPNHDQRREYCLCAVTKLTQDKEFVEKYKSEFKSGKLLNIISNLQADTAAYKLNLNECMIAVKELKWTPEFEKGIRTNITSQMTQTEISKTNDINKYCDCLVEEYKKIDINKLTGNGFYDSKENQTIDSICKLKSKRIR
jgi:hypothetical protein